MAEVAMPLEFKYLNQFFVYLNGVSSHRHTLARKKCSFDSLFAAICSVGFLFDLITWIKRLQSANNGARQANPNTHSIELQCLFKTSLYIIQYKTIDRVCISGVSCFSHAVISIITLFLFLLLMHSVYYILAVATELTLANVI